MPGPKQKPGDTYRDPDESAVYSVMAADSLETTIATTALGEIVTRGRLLDQNGNKLAGFTQTYRLWRGSRVLHVEIELDPAEEPKADPWNSYYCCPLCLGRRNGRAVSHVNETRQPCTEKRFESPHYIEIADEKTSTTILTGGLAFHRRHEDRMLDTLLITRGERQRKFRLGIGVDLAHPLHEAIGMLDAAGRRSQRPAARLRQLRLAVASQLAECHRHAAWRRSRKTAASPAFASASWKPPAGLRIWRSPPFAPSNRPSTVDFLGNTLAELPDRRRQDQARPGGP